VKKLLTIVICVLLWVGLAWGEAPFDKAKEFALKATPDANGSYILRFNINEDGFETTYLLGYLSKWKVIGVGVIKGSEVCVFQYEEETQEYSVFYNGMVMIVDKAKVIEGALIVFRELVKKNLL